MDAADFDGIGELFADGALLDPDGSELARGRDAVARFYRQIIVLHDGSPRTLHITGNSDIEVDESTGSVTARSDYVVSQAVHGPPTRIAEGHYDDRFHVVDGEWRFAERRFFVDRLHDVSRHLR